MAWVWYAGYDTATVTFIDTMFRQQTVNMQGLIIVGRVSMNDMDVPPTCTVSSAVCRLYMTMNALFAVAHGCSIIHHS